MATSADYRLGEYAFPRGWFAVAKSAEVTRKPLNIHYFGKDMIIYRGASGRVIMLDAYCPHMGTHLGSGPNSATSTSETYMEDDNIRCPFHAWRFGSDGMCNHIPYHDGAIPPAARVKSWTVEERYGVVFCWHDPEEQAPDFEIASYPEWGQPDWVSWSGLEFLADLKHPIEIFDNMSDVTHLDHLHGGKVTAYENEYDGHILHQRQSGENTESGERVYANTITTLAGYVGPGIAFGEFVEIQAKQIICITPIDDGSCRLWQAAMLKIPEGLSAEAAEVARQRLSDSMGNGLLRDGEVWATKRPAINIMQMPGDGPFRQSRIWYSQFYNPRAKTAEILHRAGGVHLAKGMPAFTPQAAE